VSPTTIGKFSSSVENVTKLFFLQSFREHTKIEHDKNLKGTPLFQFGCSILSHLFAVLSFQITNLIVVRCCHTGHNHFTLDSLKPTWNIRNACSITCRNNIFLCVFSMTFLVMLLSFHKYAFDTICTDLINFCNTLTKYKKCELYKLLVH